jgi:hypothetical protein
VSIERASGACELGTTWLESRGGCELQSLIGGAVAPIEAAIDRAAATLSRAGAPRIVVGDGLSIEACRELALLARLLRADVVPASPISFAEERSGLDAPELAATFGSVRSTADVVVFWRFDPFAKTPRFVERVAPDATVFTVLDARESSDSIDRGGARVIVIDGPDGDLAAVQAIAARVENPDEAPAQHDELAGAVARAAHVHFVIGGDPFAAAVMRVALGRLAATHRRRWRATFASPPERASRRTPSEVFTWSTGCAPPLRFDAGGRAIALSGHPNPAADGTLLAGDAEIGPADSDVSITSQPCGADVEFVAPLMDPRVRATVVRADGISLTLGDEDSPADPVVDLLARIRVRVIDSWGRTA